MEPRFGLRREDEDDVPVVVVEGELDFGTSPELAEALKPLEGRVVVDFDETTFIDSTGLHVLMTATGDFKGGLHLACPPGGSVHGLIEAAGVGDFLNAYDSRGAALAAAKAKPSLG